MTRSATHFDLEVFYDGACPLCVHQMRLVRRLDRGGRVRFVDVTMAGFEPRSLGRAPEALLERIHGRLPDGSVVEGVEVLRRLYAAAGFRRLVALSRWPPFARLLDAGYRLVARNRCRLAGGRIRGECRVQARQEMPMDPLGRGRDT